MQCHINYLISTTKTFVRESFTSNIARLLTSSLARHFPHSPSRAVDLAPCSLACSSPPRATITAKEGNRIRWTLPLASRALFPRVVCALSSSPVRSACQIRACPPLLAAVPTSTCGGLWEVLGLCSMQGSPHRQPRLPPLCPVFPSVPSPRLGIPTSSGHGIHSARKGEGSGCVRTGSIERCCRVEEHADLCFVLQLTALVLLDLCSFLESVSHRFIYRSAGRQQGCSSSSTRSTFPLCSAHVQQRQSRLFSNTNFVGSSYALSY
jgi:hypothetical protein